MKSGYFVTGTDTGAGKTHITCGLLRAARQRGRRALAMKPVAAGVDADGFNEDVRRLWEAMRADLPGSCMEHTLLSLINPYSFSRPIVPYQAALDEGRTIQLSPIVDAYHQLSELTDLVFVEGVGGFCVPLARQFDTADLAEALALPVIIVVGMRLGCVNHALLTYEAIAKRGLTCAGWFANCIDPAMESLSHNIRLLEEWLNIPLLGVLPWGESMPETFSEGLVDLLAA